MRVQVTSQKANSAGPAQLKNSLRSFSDPLRASLLAIDTATAKRHITFSEEERLF